MSSQCKCAIASERSEECSFLTIGTLVVVASLQAKLLGIQEFDKRIGRMGMPVVGIDFGP